MKPEKLSEAEFEVILAAQPTPIDPSETAAGSTVVSLLSSLDRKVLDQVMVENRYKPGEIVVYEGQHGDIAYLIWSGRVAVVQGEFSDPASVNYRGPGEVVGEMSSPGGCEHLTLKRHGAGMRNCGIAEFAEFA